MLPQRSLLKKNLDLTLLAMGGAQLGNHPEPMSDSEAEKTIDAAYAAGIRTFDTAPLYGSGLSERRLGKALKKYNRNEIIISTKVGFSLQPGKRPKEKDLFPESDPFIAYFDYSYDTIKKSIQESLQRLQTNYLDIVHIHDLDPLNHGDCYEKMFKCFCQK